MVRIVKDAAEVRRMAFVRDEGHVGAWLRGGFDGDSG